jgi:formylglycine-generating enzyme required for sulfatase activity
MHGNVWEYCLDHWHDNYEGAPTDGSAWLSARAAYPSYVLRGGSYFYGPSDSRSASRWPSYPPCIHGIGFRVVCEIPKT